MSHHRYNIEPSHKEEIWLIMKSQRLGEYTLDSYYIKGIHTKEANPSVGYGENYEAKRTALSSLAPIRK